MLFCISGVYIVANDIIIAVPTIEKHDIILKQVLDHVEVHNIMTSFSYKYQK